MKKRMAVIICAVVLALALPCIAFAIPSGAVNGDTTTSTGIEGVSGNANELQFTAKGADWVRIRTTGYIPKNVPDSFLQSVAQGDGYVVGTAGYEITAGDNVDLDNIKVTLVYKTSTDFSGLTCYVFIEHHDGTTEELVMHVNSDGSVTVNMGKLSDVAFFITKDAFESNTTPVAADTAATSPKTGIAG